MDAKQLTCTILSTLMEMAPDSELAKLTSEFAQRSEAGDSMAFWTEHQLIDRIKLACSELQEFETLHPGKIESQASDLSKSL